MKIALGRKFHLIEECLRPDVVEPSVPELLFSDREEKTAQRNCTVSPLALHDSFLRLCSPVPEDFDRQ